MTHLLEQRPIHKLELTDGGKEERLNKRKDRKLSPSVFSNQITDLLSRQFDIYEKLQRNHAKTKLQLKVVQNQNAKLLKWLKNGEITLSKNIDIYITNKATFS